MFKPLIVPFKPIVMPKIVTVQSKPIPTTNTPARAHLAQAKPVLSAPEPAIKEVRAETMAAIGTALAPYAKPGQAPANKAVAHAADTLRMQQLIASGTTTRADDGLADKLGQAMMLGTRANAFLPGLATLDNSFTQGKDAQRNAARAIWQQAGRTAPDDATLDKMLRAAKEAHDSFAQTPQHGRLAAGSDRIEVDSAPGTGGARVSVIDPKGDDGKPERVTFGTTESTVPNAAGDGLETKVDPLPPEVVDTKTSDAERAKIDGAWVDQNGEVWEISGKGDAITFVDIYASGHRVTYIGQWSMGIPYASHLVNDVLDMDDSLPGDVKDQLASTYHPPFAVHLEYRADKDQFTGQWISGQVTYSAMWHTVKVVEDPTWDKPLILTRENPMDVFGARSEVML